VCQEERHTHRTHTHERETHTYLDDELRLIVAVDTHTHERETHTDTP